ncbi:hypothetical protein DFH08DRAFT_810418 [Mycena albidolilacea]|uniref:Uncharacterized protein n=1 Tax=Mycena albidolilacea TaxID=1033008 RepID=A0AAD7EP53_9AGAR|nr:hypothetical protein DFH08DRAFT_810418 [Mycena albidolilacea]
MVPHPPMKSKYATDEPTDYENLVQRHLERNEKARLRMARKRAELKSRSLEEQAAAAERERRYQATYRERNRNDLRIWEAHRRLAIYKAKHGPELYESYLKAQHNRRRRTRAKRKAKEPYDSSDERDVASPRLIDGGRQEISE